MILSKNDLCHVKGGISSSESPPLPTKSQSQNVDPQSNTVVDPTKPIEPPKP